MSQNQRGVGCRTPSPRPASPFHPFCPRAPGNPAEPGKPPLPLAPFRPNRKPEGKTHKDGTSAQPRACCLLPAREGLQPYLPTDDHPPPNSSPGALRKTSSLWPLLPGLEDTRTPVISVFPLKSTNRHLYFSDTWSPKRSFDFFFNHVFYLCVKDLRSPQPLVPRKTKTQSKTKP